MIVGNSIIIGGGGLKSTDAVLAVAVPTGSTVTATKSGVTLTPTVWASETASARDVALFVIAPSLFDSQNAWTVITTKGEQTRSVTVTVDSAKIYELTIEFAFYLIRNGVIQDGYTGTASAASGTVFQSNYNGLGYTRLYGAADSNNGHWRGGTISPSYDFTDSVYTLLKVDFEIADCYASSVDYYPRLGVGPTNASTSFGDNDWSVYGYLAQESGAVARTISSIDISTLNAALYLKMAGRSSTARAFDAHFYNVWLE